jgi:hypothetical protein
LKSLEEFPLMAEKCINMFLAMVFAVSKCRTGGQVLLRSIPHVLSGEYVGS